jgi:hypothetical protein
LVLSKEIDVPGWPAKLLLNKLHWFIITYGTLKGLDLFTYGTVKGFQSSTPQVLKEHSCQSLEPLQLVY